MADEETVGQQDSGQTENGAGLAPQDKQGELETGEGQAGTTEPLEIDWEAKAKETERKLKSAERNADRFRQQADYFRGLTTKPVEQPPETAPKQEQEPVIEDFLAHPDKYPDPYAALASATAKYEVRRAREEDRKQAEQAKQSQAQQEWLADVQGKARQAAAKYPDFAEVVLREVEDGGPPITSVMLEAMRESESFADLAYHLGKHPEVAEEIAGLSPSAQIRAIGRLEAQLESGVTPAPTVTRQSSIRTIRSVGGRSSPTINLEKIPMDEYARLRNKQVRRG